MQEHRADEIQAEYSLEPGCPKWLQEHGMIPKNARVCGRENSEGKSESESV